MIEIFWNSKHRIFIVCAFRVFQLYLCTLNEKLLISICDFFFVCVFLSNETKKLKYIKVQRAWNMYMTALTWAQVREKKIRITIASNQNKSKYRYIILWLFFFFLVVLMLRQQILFDIKTTETKADCKWKKSHLMVIIHCKSIYKISQLISNHRKRKNVDGKIVHLTASRGFNWWLWNGHFYPTWCFFLASNHIKYSFYVLSHSDDDDDDGEDRSLSLCKDFQV